MEDSLGNTTNILYELRGADVKMILLALLSVMEMPLVHDSRDFMACHCVLVVFFKCIVVVVVKFNLFLLLKPNIAGL